MKSELWPGTQGHIYTIQHHELWMCTAQFFAVKRPQRRQQQAAEGGNVAYALYYVYVKCAPCFVRFGLGFAAILFITTTIAYFCASQIKRSPGKETGCHWHIST